MSETTKPNRKNFVSLAILLGAVWFPCGCTENKPLTLADAVENVAPRSIKPVTLTLPYPGKVTIEANVVRGNNLDISVVETNQLENIRAERRFSEIPDFQATKTKDYRRSSQLKS